MGRFAKPKPGQNPAEVQILYAPLIILIGGLLYGLGGVALIALAFCDIELKEKESENPI